VPVLDRYIVRELFSPFCFGGALFTFFLVIDRIYHLTDLVITKGVPFYLVIQLLAFMLPSFLAHTLPMALLVAVLLAGGRLAGDLEIIACKAAGISTLRLFRPVLGAAVVVMAVTASLTLIVNPLANQEFQRQLFKILQARASSGLAERVFNPTFGDVIIYVEDVSASQVALHGLLVSDERDPKISRIITAREITLRLINGAVSEADVLPAAPVVPATTPGDAPPSGGAASAARYRLTNFSIYDMSLSFDSPLRSAPRVEKPEKDLSLGALHQQLDQVRDPAGRAPFLVEWHKRFAFPVAAVVFALVAFPLAVRSHRGGRSIALVASVAILVACGCRPGSPSGFPTPSSPPSGPHCSSRRRESGRCRGWLRCGVPSRPSARPCPGGSESPGGWPPAAVTRHTSWIATSCGSTWCSWGSACRWPPCCS
jgi:lipopolysaccharide export system permease protein